MTPEALRDLLQTLNAVDAVLLAVLLLSLIVGWVRGFTFEMLSLLGWIVAWFAAVYGSPSLAEHLPIGSAGSRLNLAAAFVAAFVATLLVWGVAARLVRMAVHATPLNAADRTLGSAFGLIRGAVILLIVAALLPMTPWAQARIWRDSAMAGLLGDVLVELRPLLPAAQRVGRTAK